MHRVIQSTVTQQHCSQWTAAETLTVCAALRVLWVWVSSKAKVSLNNFTRAHTVNENTIVYCDIAKDSLYVLFYCGYSVIDLQQLRRSILHKINSFFLNFQTTWKITLVTPQVYNKVSPHKLLLVYHLEVWDFPANLRRWANVSRLQLGYDFSLKCDDFQQAWNITFRPTIGLWLWYSQYGLILCS